MKNEQKIDEAMEKAMQVSRKRGAELVQAGLVELKKEYNERLVKFVSHTMNRITDLQTQIENLQDAIEFQKDRLQAINDGKFKVDAHGNITFHEEKLNAGLGSY